MSSTSKKGATKLFVIDLDDTLIGLSHRISRRNVAAIKKVISRKIPVAIATGRTFQTTEPFGNRLGITLPLICYHGALVRTKHKVYIERMLPEEYYHSLISFARRLRVQICFYVSHHNIIYFNRPLNKFAKEYLDKIERVREITLVNFKTYMLPRTPIKCMMIGPEDRIAKLEAMAKRKWRSKMYITRSRPKLLEFLNPDVSKGKAVKFLADKIGVPMRNVTVIGDSYNDLSMFKAAGRAIAVRNAPHDVELAADHVVSSWDHDGVAEAIEKYILP
ncbi:Cof-type HAD-IIB family hydrolase [Patescibacteria group bacterium]